MGLTQLVSPYYRALSGDTFKRSPVIGQICWVTVPIIPPIPQILDVTRADDRRHDWVEGQIRNIKETDFRQKKRLPILKLQLRDHEELLVARAKKRMGIIVAMSGTAFPDVANVLKAAGKKHLQENNVLVAPIYGSQTSTHVNGFPPIMRNRIGALMYSQFFPVAGNSSPPIYDGVARLDRLLAVCPNFPAYEPVALALADEALSVLLALLRLRAGSRSEPEIDGLRDLLLETVKAEYLPAEEPQAAEGPAKF